MYKRLISEKYNTLYSKTMAWIRCTLILPHAIGSDVYLKHLTEYPTLASLTDAH